MILVDSSVWIDYFRGRATDKCNLLHRLLGAERLLTGDPILARVSAPRLTSGAPLYLLGTLEFLPLAGREIAIGAARLPNSTE
jgi:hypothetical protein